MGMVGLEDFEELVEFLGADGLFLYEVAVEEIDGDGGFGMVDDVGTSLGSEGCRAEAVGVGMELGEGFVRIVTADGIVAEVVGCGFIGKVIARTDEDDLFHAVGEDKVVGDELAGLAPIEERAVLDGEGVDAGVGGGEVIEIEFACLHIGDVSAEAEGITIGTTGCEE